MRPAKIERRNDFRGKERRLVKMRQRNGKKKRQHQGVYVSRKVLIGRKVRSVLGIQKTNSYARGKKKKTGKLF